MICPPCIGSGYSKIGPGLCAVCDGRGTLPDDATLVELCRACIGRGIDRSRSSLCTVCDGVGRLREPGVKPTSDSPLVFCVESGKPRTAHLALADICASLSGPLAICDPYYGLGSLLRLDALTHCAPIRFLTKNVDKADASVLPKAVTEWNREFGQLEVRTCATKDIHDRYILTPTELVILGHGLKDIGNKDSFIVRLPQAMSSDLLTSILDAFDAKWKLAKPI